MVDMDWKAKTATPDIPGKPAKVANKALRVAIPSDFRVAEILSPAPASLSACALYEQYLRLPELAKLWTSREFPAWSNEPVVKPALQALEMTFRFISSVLSDPRPYANRREWERRLELLATNQVQIIAALCEDGEEDPETRGTAPIVDLSSTNGVLVRDGSLTEVWKIPGESPVVSRTSEASLLPRLAEWHKSEDIAQKILYSIECEMRRCPYTLGIGEPNLAGKPNLEYDLICKPQELHRLKKTPMDHIQNYENQTLHATHQILESWIFAAKMLLNRISDKIEREEFDKASSDSWLLERVWKLLSEIEDLNLLLDPDDFLRLRNELQIRATNESEALCFRSKQLIDVMKRSKELKHKVPHILGVEVDPKGGPRVQDAAMKLYRGKGGFEKIHLLQAMQAVESAVKKFFYGYKLMVVAVFGSLEAKASSGSVDSLSQIFLEPTYFPSLDAAKTFLGDFWSNESRRR
uniref:Nematode resistance protein-like HSPRO2 n=1 Tax=Kalanchoe fedtschenkoi TaxID=63787 RepID=A0A7N0ZU99_KALFE